MIKVLSKWLRNFGDFKMVFLLFVWSNSRAKKYVFKYNWLFL